MQFCTLFSGSSGNCAYLSTERGALLIDCGMSGKQTLEALEKAQLDISAIHALLITHEHSDHVKGAGVISRKLGIPIYATEGTWEGMYRTIGDVPKHRRVAIHADESFFLDDIEALPFHIPHDANEPTGYRFFMREHSVAVATDLGHFSRFVFQAIESADIVLLESNHDPEMLQNNPNYPAHLKTRILGRKGHLSNFASAQAAVKLLQSGTRHLLLGHLSQENNTPEIAERIVSAALTETGAVIGEDITLHVADRSQTGYLYRIQEMKMEFRVLDEIVEIEGKGLMLFAAAEDCAALFDGCAIRDSRGNVHIVDKIARNEAVTTLYIGGGDANYFERLFRDVMIDATLFALCGPEADG